MMLLDIKIFLKNKQVKKPLRRKDVSSWLFEESVIAYSITDFDFEEKFEKVKQQQLIDHRTQKEKSFKNIALRKLKKANMPTRKETIIIHLISRECMKCMR